MFHLITVTFGRPVPDAEKDRIIRALRTNPTTGASRWVGVGARVRLEFVVTGDGPVEQLRYVAGLRPPLFECSTHDGAAPVGPALTPTGGSA